MEAPDAAWLKEFVRDIPDFPKPGVGFKDITPLLADLSAFQFTIEALAAPFNDIDKVLGIEARGFIIAAPVAYHLGTGFVPVRKAGKLPHDIESEEYALEYGTDLLEIHRDAVRPGERVLIVDDVIATGGTAEATVTLARRLCAEVAGLAFVVELAFLGGRGKLAGEETVSLITYN